MAKEGGKVFWVKKEYYDKLQAPTVMQKPIGDTGGCRLVQINGPDGIRFECRGSCGFIDSILGRSCGKVVQNAGGGVQVFCACSGGWWDRLWS